MTTTSANANAHEESWGLTHTGRLAYLEERLGVTAAQPSLKQRKRRALLYMFVTWVVPCALSFAPTGTTLTIPFAFDIEAHVRGLIAVPLLLLAEWPIEQRLRIVIRRLGSPPLMRPSGRVLLGDRIHWARRVGGHPLAEAVLLVLAFAIGVRWAGAHEVGLATWVSVPRDGVDTLTPAGAWEAAVVVPIYAFLALRWLWRWVVLALLFGRVSKLRLRLVANHGDRAAGLGFVSEASIVFAWVLMAASSVACAKGMDDILYRGVAARTFTSTIQMIAGAGVAWAFFPLFAFTPRLVVFKRLALRRYTDIVAKHGLAVERRWVSPVDRVNSETASSMIDLASVHAIVQGIRILPTNLRPVLIVAVATVLPLLPIIFQIVPAREVLVRLLRALA